MAEFEPERDLGVIDAIARAFDCELAGGTRGALASYVEQVSVWNQKINLTGARGARALCEVLLADAFALAKGTLLPDSARLLDVGSGAGAPIVPLLLLREDLRATCVEPLHKRVAFLRTASGRLGLVPRIELREGRIDASAPAAPPGAFDVASSRATFAPEVWLGVGLALAPRVLVMLSDAAPPSAPPGARLAETADYVLPFSGSPRRLAIYLRE